MRLTTKSRYGTMLLIDLARYYDEGPVKISAISKRQDISLKYLEQIIRILKKAELVKSVRGPKGGHMLKQRPEDITLGQIVRLFEAQSDLAECISQPEKCSISDNCRIRVAWQEANQALFEKLDTITIADLE